MNNFFRLLLILAYYASIISCQTETFYEKVSLDKIEVVSRNIVLISSDSPSKIRVSYYETNNKVKNELVTKELSTPCFLNLGDALIRYDSLDFVRNPNRHIIRGVKRYKRSFTEGGSEYFKIENLSDKKIKIAIIGTKELHTEKSNSKNNEVIISHPNPVFKGIPILYLLFPQYAPDKTLYYEAIEGYKKQGDLISIEKTPLKKIDLYKNHLGMFSNIEIPFSIDHIISIYEHNYQELYLNYKDYALSLIGVNDTKTDWFLRRHNLKLFQIVEPRQIFINNGTIPLLETSFEEQLYFHL